MRWRAGCRAGRGGSWSADEVSSRAYMTADRGAPVAGAPALECRGMSQAQAGSEHPAPRRPLSIGAGAVVIHDQRVLLVRNVRGVTRGRYLLPAGRAEPNELPDQA